MSKLKQQCGFCTGRGRWTSSLPSHASGDLLDLEEGPGGFCGGSIYISNSWCWDAKNNLQILLTRCGVYDCEMQTLLPPCELTAVIITAVYVPRVLHFHQHVKCATRGSNTLDHLYTNVKQAFTAAQLSHIGNSDHLTALLKPAYRPRVRQEPPVVRDMGVCPQEAIPSLQGCFECTVECYQRGSYV